MKSAEVQTGEEVSKTLVSTESQTMKRGPDEEEKRMQVRNLSPFETYDLIFLRDLINNLNYDNEVLFDNQNDLKAAFMFIYNEHQHLLFKYKKEKRN